MSQHPTRRQFLQQAAAIPAASAVAQLAGLRNTAAAEEPSERKLDLQAPQNVRQTDILYDPAMYTAFPHVVRLNKDELLIAFRQAPREDRIRHTNPRSIITIMRSYDLGQTWDVKGSTQFAAGGGQELALIALGNGHVGGLLAMHEVVPMREAKRSGLSFLYPNEYPHGNVGGFWCWSNNDGLSWRLNHNVLFAPGMQPCAPPIRLQSGALLAPIYGSDKNDGFESALVYRSDDLGKTWSGKTVMADGNPSTRPYYEPAIIEVARDHVLAVHRVGHTPTGNDSLFWWNESRDAGKTWSQPVETDIVSGACPRLLKLADGRILLTYGRRYKPAGLHARLSKDGGKTWSKTSWVLREFPKSDQGYSSSVEIAPGKIFTVCYAQNENGITGITGTFWDVPKA